MKGFLTVALLGTSAFLSAGYSNGYSRPNCPNFNKYPVYDSYPTQNNSRSYYNSYPSGNQQTNYYYSQPQSVKQESQQSNGSYYNKQPASDNSWADDNESKPANGDQAIYAKVKEALSSGWFSKGYQNITYSVSSGNVNLGGTVATIDDKNKIEENVKKIDGVKNINNQITVTGQVNGNGSEKYSQDSAVTADDKKINESIRSKLAEGWLSKGYDTVIIRTSNGIVVISGAVDGVDDVEKINNHVTNTPGVKSVNNQLTVKNK